MINIREDTCNKLPGLSSAFISFDYNPNLVALIKQHCEVFNYNKKNREWEVPIKNISDLIDQFCIFDEISINTKVDTKNAIERKFDGSGLKFDLFRHQIEAIEYGINHDKWLLLDDMGLGKTGTALCVASELKKIHNLQHCLIICGVNSSKANWKNEIRKFTDLSATILGERITRNGNIVYDGNEEKANQLKNTIDDFFVITNIESVRNDKIVEAYQQSVNTFDMIIFDEFHVCKDTNTIQFKNLDKLKAKYKIGLTGTPIVNSPIDAYAPLKWIEVEKSTLTNFKSYYCLFSDRIRGLIIGSKNLDVLKDELKTCSLRRTKDLLDLPPKNIITEYVDMDNTHRKLYEEIVNKTKEDNGLSNNLIDKVKIVKKNLLGIVVRLMQGTSCPQMLTTTDIISSKVDRCKEMVYNILEMGEKVVVFSTFKEVVNQVKDKLLEYNPLVVTGDTKEGLVSEYIDRFQNNSNDKILIATWQKLGTAVTLTAARYMIFIDCPWTATAYNQATDRIFRIGQTKSVFIYNLVCPNTIDEATVKAINRKQALGDYIIDDKIRDETSLEILQQYVEEL